MPLYAYHCDRCGGDFERFLRPSEAARGFPCPTCGEPVAEGRAEQGDPTPPGEPSPVCGVPKGT
jgi:putative FmdB family regulatory protein